MRRPNTGVPLMSDVRWGSSLRTSQHADEGGDADACGEHQEGPLCLGEQGVGEAAAEGAADRQQVQYGAWGTKSGGGPPPTNVQRTRAVASASVQRQAVAMPR